MVVSHVSDFYGHEGQNNLKKLGLAPFGTGREVYSAAEGASHARSPRFDDDVVTIRRPIPGDGRGAPATSRRLTKVNHPTRRTAADVRGEVRRTSPR